MEHDVGHEVFSTPKRQKVEIAVPSPPQQLVETSLVPNTSVTTPKTTQKSL